MVIALICLAIAIFQCAIIIYFASVYNKFQVFMIRINEAETNIDSVLRKRFDLLSKSIDVIKENTGTKDNILKSIDGLKSKKLSNFDLDRKLYDGLKEFSKYKEKYPKLKNNESFVTIDVELNASEAEIVALRKYYNDIITDYNKLVRSFPSNLIAICFKFKTKMYFDGKNQEDEDIYDFKL